MSVFRFIIQHGSDFQTSTHYLQRIIIFLVLGLLGPHRDCQRWDLLPQSGHALSLSHHGQNLGVKVHKQFGSFWVFDQE